MVALKPEATARALMPCHDDCQLLIRHHCISSPGVFTHLSHSLLASSRALGLAGQFLAELPAHARSRQFPHVALRRVLACRESLSRLAGHIQRAYTHLDRRFGRPLVPPYSACSVT